MVCFSRWARGWSTFAALAAAACGGSIHTGEPAPVTPGSECAGAGTALASDGCNTCVCIEGKWSCTEKACPATCTPGATKPAGDGCNMCSCMADGTWACTHQTCTGPKACGGFAGKTCGPSEYCAYEPGQLCGAADALATCKPRPQACDQIFAPVCGCDQKTYDNSCMAAMAGTGMFSEGSCTAPPACVDGEMIFDGCNTCTCSGGSWACTNRACPPPMECTPGQTKPAGDGCNNCSCSATGQWQCTTVACGGKACGARAGNACSASEYCAYQPGQYCGAADAESTCQPRPSICTLEITLVCGCDQKTYGNACTAAAAGTGIYSTGACPAP